MDSSKITQSLKTHLEKSPAAKEIDVVVELTPDAEAIYPENSSRSQKMQHLKQAFNDKLQPVADEISNKGGNILDSVWINQTVHAKLPADCLEALALLKEVHAIDLPKSIMAD